MANLSHGRSLSSWALLLGLLAIPAAAGAQPLGPVAGKAARHMEAAAGEPLVIEASPLTGLAIFVAARQGPGIPVKALASASAGERALSFLGAYGKAFGIADRAEVAVRRVSAVDEVGMEHVRVQQLHGGVPVTAGELMVHLRGAYVVAANGETLGDLGGVPTRPVLGAEAAREAVRERLTKHGTTGAVLSRPRLEVFNRGLLEDRRYPTRLAWFVEARRLDLWERFWIDAENGVLLLRFSQLPQAKNRLVYNSNSTSTLPGTLVRVEGGPATGNPDVDAAYDYAGNTYDYYFTQHGRDSYDGAGATLKLSVDYCPSPADCPYRNAFWNGTQMVYGDGFPVADDVDAHELTHAVTNATADLFYYMQSGALNESFSDIFGETVDLMNGSGTDTSGVRWLMGEDVPVFGALRNMMDPTVFNDPGKTSDAVFNCTDPGADNGGVHTNSSVPNHAYALMVDGGSYNGFNVTGIGLVKAGKVEYRALTQYLLSGSGFLDDYQALNQSCLDLVGVAGITSGDCAEVAKALDAVELSYGWWCTSAQEQFDPCLAKAPDAVAFFDDLESGGPDWVVAAAGGSSPEWSLGALFATSGTQHIWGRDREVLNDSAVFNGTPVVLPAHAYLYFRHAFGFENNGTEYYDAGVLEYSVNGGSWADAGSLIDHGASYGGVISECCSNPLKGRAAFVADSYGYTATRLDLSSLAGQSFQVRFRIASDPYVDDAGWFIDDVGIYQCLPDLIFSDGFESGNTSAWSAKVP